MQGADEPRSYPNVGGDGGEVPFTPSNPPAVTDRLLDHVMIGKPKKNGWDGGHGFGAGKGKSEFPKTWDRAKIRQAIAQVLRNPAEITRRGSTLYFYGTVDGQRMVVRTKGRVQGAPRIWAAYPLND